MLLTREAFRFTRAVDTIEKKKGMHDLTPTLHPIEHKFRKNTRADFAREIDLNGATLFPRVQIPESYYLLALVYEQLNQNEESVFNFLSAKELLLIQI